MTRAARHWSRSDPGYALAAAALLLAQHGLVALLAWWLGKPLVADANFWWLPWSWVVDRAGPPGPELLVALPLELAILWLLVRLSLIRAGGERWRAVTAALTLVPGAQVVAVFVLALAPTRTSDAGVGAGVGGGGAEVGANARHVAQGVLAGVAILVGAVALSAATLGTYGWGLFVATPCLVGVTTAYLANREHLLSAGRTQTLVLAAAALGCVALITVALEGLICLVMAAPLGAVAAILGGVAGRALARTRHHRGAPLASVALLPLLFGVEAALPPVVAIQAQRSVVIDATPRAVWAALTSDAPVTSRPGLIELAGLATPVRGRLLGQGVGATRLGEFSTGVAVERVTEWRPGRRLSVEVLSQPPMMEEMSPYRRVHAPHVSGYFTTRRMSYALRPTAHGGTRLTVEADHELRIDPVAYWRPVAAWAIGRNLDRVLTDIERKALSSAGSRIHRTAAGEG